MVCVFRSFIGKECTVLNMALKRIFEEANTISEINRVKTIKPLDAPVGLVKQDKIQPEGLKG